jgi:hypothetical protein
VIVSANTVPASINNIARTVMTPERRFIDPPLWSYGW